MGRTVEDLQADIEAGVAALVAGEGWQRWLGVATRFPKYSFRNRLLILAQRPDARAVMGYRAWQALGHQVRRGETSISIFAPCTYKAKQRASAELASELPPDDQTCPEDDGGEGERGSGRRVLRGFRVARGIRLPCTRKGRWDEGDPGERVRGARNHASRRCPRPRDR